MRYNCRNYSRNLQREKGIYITATVNVLNSFGVKYFLEKISVFNHRKTLSR